MADALDMIDQTPVQDRDLLLRLSLYFDAFEQRLRQGQGWFIFNASTERSRRIANVIQIRLAEYGSSVSSYMLSWRDFAITAYVSEVELPAMLPFDEGTDLDDDAKRELQVAKLVTADIHERLKFSDVVVLTGLKPSSWHEATYLDRTIDERYRNRLATILLTPELPNELEAGFQQLDPTSTFWPRIFARMYETSLVAL
jgi:hypothetical protein